MIAPNSLIVWASSLVVSSFCKLRYTEVRVAERIPSTVYIL